MNKILFLSIVILLGNITTNIFSFEVIQESFTSQDKDQILSKTAGFNQSFIDSFDTKSFITVKVYKRSNKELIEFAFLKRDYTDNSYVINSLLIFNNDTGKGVGTAIINYLKEHFQKLKFPLAFPLSSFLINKGDFKQDGNYVVYENPEIIVEK